VVGMLGQTVSLGQTNGPDVELVVTGTELYATYETPEGYPAVYDDRSGLFCFARVVDGAFHSTGVPVTSAPPADVDKHAKESDAVRVRKIAQRQSQMERRSRPSSQRHQTKPAKE
jgi:hypothetical protein